MNRLLTCLGLFFLGAAALASPTLDRRYALERLAVAVTNAAEEPIYADQIEASITEWLAGQLRFSYGEDASRALKEGWAGRTPPSLGVPGNEAIDFLQGLLTPMAQQGANGALLFELRAKESGHDLFASLIIVPTGEVVHSLVLPVLPERALSSYGLTAREAAETLVAAIPFDGAIVSREGYRVVINRGHPALRGGQRIAVHTVEEQNGELIFEETGTVEITSAEGNLAFGQVVVEKENRKVAAGNKLRLRPQYDISRPPFGPTPGSRTLASVLSVERAFQKGELGVVNLDVGANFLTLSLTSQNGNVSESATLPGAALRGELWLTGRVFVDLGFQVGNTTLTTTSSGQTERLNASLSDFQMRLGYRLLLDNRLGGPTLRASLGYSAHRFTIDRARNPLYFGTANFGGLSVGLGARLPLTEKWAVGADVAALMFPSVDEGTYTSGSEVTSVSAIHFMVRGYYNLAPDLDLEARLLLQGFSAEFSGTGTRPVPLLSTSRSARALGLGLSYFF